jgi:hypothetical protein
MNRDDVIEAMARAYVREAILQGSHVNDAACKSRLAASFAALEPAGMVIVPREATHKMIGEGHGAALVAPSGLASIEAIYRAMLAASPFAAAMGEG